MSRRGKRPPPPERHRVSWVIVATVAAGVVTAAFVVARRAPRMPAAVSIPAGGEHAPVFLPTRPNTAGAPAGIPDGMVWIPGGEFSMGAADPQGMDDNDVGMNATRDSRPVHRVYVDGFFMDKLKELQNDFWIEAKKYNVLPLDDRFGERLDPHLRPSLIAERTDFSYYAGAIAVPESSAADTKNTSHTITATIDVPQGGADGVLVAEGGVAGGYALYIKDGRPIYEYNYVGQTHTKIASMKPLSPGAVTIRVEFKYDGGGVGKGGDVTLFINDEKVGEGRIDKTELGRFGTENFDIGMDNGSPVSEDYDSPFAFDGTIKKVEINIRPHALSASDKRKIRDAEHRMAIAIE